jgi:hypothetical protein
VASALAEVSLVCYLRGCVLSIISLKMSTFQKPSHVLPRQALDLSEVLG